MIAKATVISTVPVTIQIRRRPKRLVVRSESRPTTTFAIVAKRAPKPPSTAAAPVAPSCAISPDSTSAWIFRPMPTTAGPSSAMKKISCAASSQKT